jgi:hypothetical protein
MVMKLGKILSVVLVALASGCLFGTEGAGAKPVMAHYMPWFESQPYSGYWGWHWTMNHFNPNTDNTNGYPEIASWFYPPEGPYDSADPNVLEYHVLLMKLAGIDGVIADWYGTDNFDDYALINQRTGDMFAYLQKAGMQFCLCYEDATIQQEINGGLITATGAVAHAQQTMLYVQTKYFDAPGYLHWNNMPVLLNFGPQYFTANSQWVSIFSVLNNSNQPAFFTEDNRLAVGQGAFDWPPMWMSATNNGIVTDAMMETYLSIFEEKGFVWPAYISTAFPRFHDIYQQAGVSASYGYLDDQNGKTLTENLTRAMTNNSVIVQIATWNDFGEGTIIEPTVTGISGCALIDTNKPTTEYGYTDLGIVQNLRRQYLNPAFPYTTNDLALPYQLLSMRELFGNTNPIITAELNRAFSNIVSGNLSFARLQLNGVQSGVPVIYNLSLTNGQFQFFVGGYLSQNGFQVETSSNLMKWQTVSTLPGSTNQPVYSTTLSPGPTPYFFRIQND